MKVTNLHTQPIDLEDGTILAAARTEGSTKTVSSLSENDERLVDRGLISISSEPLKAVPRQEKSPAPAPRAAEGAVEKIAEADDATGKGDKNK